MPEAFYLLMITQNLLQSFLKLLFKKKFLLQSTFAGKHIWIFFFKQHTFIQFTSSKIHKKIWIKTV